jgi:pimeloyl-ACP methyl ester carboxylesterase
MTAVIPHSPLTDRLQRFAPQVVAVPGGQVAYRQAGNQRVSHVLLHGIGSASASWLLQLEAANEGNGLGLLAWDAPGYGNSSALAPAQPDAGHYAQRLWAWLDALGISHPVTLVGHSLGALMVARAAVQRPGQAAQLVLLAPAQGYAQASAFERDKKLNERLRQLAELGPHGVGQQRGAGMVSPQAAPELVDYIQGVMAQIQVAGYTQAAHLLSGGDLLADLHTITQQAICPVVVASGHLDRATLLQACQAVAAAAKTPWVDLGAVGHACALQAAPLVNDLLCQNSDLEHLKANP